MQPGDKKILQIPAQFPAYCCNFSQAWFEVLRKYSGKEVIIKKLPDLELRVELQGIPAWIIDLDGEAWIPAAWLQDVTVLDHCQCSSRDLFIYGCRCKRK